MVDLHQVSPAVIHRDLQPSNLMATGSTYITAPAGVTLLGECSQAAQHWQNGCVKHVDSGGWQVVAAGLLGTPSSRHMQDWT